ncbi:MAG TPA: hypothetical protein VNO43_18925 [Candidatus Eisenbacteria bacterium]|nr:hypothetical protein [Candidatus Eisenbacteria bacterium]
MMRLCAGYRMTGGGSRAFVAASEAWVFLALRAPAVFACAVCVTGGAGDPSADAYGWSVLFLMAAPYAVAGSVAAWLIYRYRRAALEDRAPEQAEPAGVK